MEPNDDAYNTNLRTASGDDLESSPPNPDGAITNNANMLTANTSNSGSRMEPNLHSWIRCIVCQAVRLGKLYQCINGHLLCNGCYQTRIWDVNVGSNNRNCPQCKVKFYILYRCRNLIAEYVVAEMKVQCDTCSKMFKNRDIRQHMLECEYRLIECKYQRLGCQRKGKLTEKHADTCKFGLKKGAELLEVLRQHQQKSDEKERLLNSIFQMNNLTQRTFQVLPFITLGKDFKAGHVAQFEAFACKWSVWLKIKPMEDQLSLRSEQDDEMPDEQLSSIVLQLKLESIPEIFMPFNLKWTWVHSIHCDIEFNLNLTEWEFSKEKSMGPAAIIYQKNSKDCHKLVEEKGLYVRIFMTSI